jgi:hypothetical protein
MGDSQSIELAARMIALRFAWIGASAQRARARRTCAARAALRRM